MGTIKFRSNSNWKINLLPILIFLIFFGVPLSFYKQWDWVIVLFIMASLFYFISFAKIIEIQITENLIKISFNIINVRYKTIEYKFDDAKIGNSETDPTVDFIFRGNSIATFILINELEEDEQILKQLKISTRDKEYIIADVNSAERVFDRLKTIISKNI